MRVRSRLPADRTDRPARFPIPGRASRQWLKGAPESPAELQSIPRHGASWEGFALEQLCAVAGFDPVETFFWGTCGGAEVDLVVERGGKRHGLDFKATEAPSVPIR